MGEGETKQYSYKSQEDAMLFGSKTKRAAHMHLAGLPNYPRIGRQLKIIITMILCLNRNLDIST